IGGLPDLPAGMPWPRLQKSLPDKMSTIGTPPLLFLIQINCAHLAPFDLDGLLPPRGILYFFYRMVYAANRFEDDWRIVFVEDEKPDLRRAEPPVELPPNELFRGLA